MTKLIIHNLKPDILQRLAALAKRHDRPLEEEVRAILTQAVMAIHETPLAANENLSEEELERHVLHMEQQMRDHARKLGQSVDDTPWRSPEEQQKIEAALEGLRELRQHISNEAKSDQLSIRQMREEGRRY
jgi:plasmid stability protein